MKTVSDLRHLARRLALQVLFEWSFLSKEPTQALLEIENQLLGEDEEKNFKKIKAHHSAWALCQALVTGVTINQEKIDKIIQKAAPEWPIEQLSKLDSSILRLAIFEILQKIETPPKVAIDEAVELAKEFGSDNSAKFVNGVLGTVLRQMENTE